MEGTLFWLRNIILELRGKRYKMGAKEQGTSSSKTHLHSSLIVCNPLTFSL
jgi:hypothetical protein